MFLAAYRGDTFLCEADTYREMADKLKITLNYAYCLGCESYAKQKRQLRIYKYDD